MFNYLFVILLLASTLFNCNASIANIDSSIHKKINRECVQNSEFDLPLATPSTEDSAHTSERLITELYSKKDLAKISLTAASCLLFIQMAILLHECGHAAAAKIFNSTANPHIYMWYDPSKNKKLVEDQFFNLCGLRFKKNILSEDFSFLAGFTAIDQNSDKWKNVGIGLAGGTATLVLGYLIFTAHAIWQKYKETKNLSQSIKFGFTNALTPYKNLFLSKEQSKLDIVLQLAFISIATLIIILSTLSTYFPTFRHADGSRVWGQIFKGAGQEIYIPDISEQLTGAVIFGNVIRAGIMIALAYKSVKTYEKYFNESILDRSHNVLEEIEVVPQIQ